MEAFKGKKQQQETYIPTEILHQIIEHLPLKSLARFKYASKRWFSMTKSIIRCHLLKKTYERIIEFNRLRQSVMSLFDAMNELLDQEYDAHLENNLCDRVKCKLDLLQFLIVFPDDDDMNRCVDGVDGLRASINNCWLNAVDSFVGFLFLLEEYVVDE